MSKKAAERVFIEKMIEFCRAHRASQRINPALASEARYWELKLALLLKEPPPSARDETVRKPSV